MADRIRDNAVEFAEWIRKQGWTSGRSIWWKMDDSKYVTRSSETLYEEFVNHKEK